MHFTSYLEEGRLTIALTGEIEDQFPRQRDLDLPLQLPDQPLRTVMIQFSF